VMAGVWRVLTALLVHPRSPENRSVVSLVARESKLVVVVVAILGCVGVGLFPQFLAPLAAQVAETYTFFIP
jgi:hypothetical protein